MKVGAFPSAGGARPRVYSWIIKIVQRIYYKVCPMPRPWHTAVGPCRSNLTEIMWSLTLCGATSHSALTSTGGRSHPLLENGHALWRMRRGGLGGQVLFLFAAVAHGGGLAGSPKLDAIISSYSRCLGLAGGGQLSSASPSSQYPSLCRSDALRKGGGEKILGWCMSLRGLRGGGQDSRRRPPFQQGAGARSSRGSAGGSLWRTGGGGEAGGSRSRSKHVDRDASPVQAGSGFTAQAIENLVRGHNAVHGGGGVTRERLLEGLARRRKERETRVREAYMQKRPENRAAIEEIMRFEEGEARGEDSGLDDDGFKGGGQGTTVVSRSLIPDKEKYEYEDEGEDEDEDEEGGVCDQEEDSGGDEGGGDDGDDFEDSVEIESDDDCDEDDDDERRDAPSVDVHGHAETGIKSAKRKKRDWAVDETLSESGSLSADSPAYRVKMHEQKNLRRMKKKDEASRVAAEARERALSQVSVVFSYFDGFRALDASITVRVPRNGTVGDAVAHARKAVNAACPECPVPAGEDLCLVKHWTILPDNATFHRLIESRAEGRIGSLFGCWCESEILEDATLAQFEEIEAAPSRVARLVRLGWLRNNSHMFPYRYWEDWRPDRSLIFWLRKQRQVMKTFHNAMPGHDDKVPRDFRDYWLPSDVLPSNGVRWIMQVPHAQGVEHLRRAQEDPSLVVFELDPADYRHEELIIALKNEVGGRRKDQGENTPGFGLQMTMTAKRERAERRRKTQRIARARQV